MLCGRAFLPLRLIGSFQAHSRFYVKSDNGLWIFDCAGLKIKPDQIYGFHVQLMYSDAMFSCLSSSKAP